MDRGWTSHHISSLSDTFVFVCSKVAWLSRAESSTVCKGDGRELSSGQVALVFWAHLDGGPWVDNIVCIAVFVRYTFGVLLLVVLQEGANFILVVDVIGSTISVVLNSQLVNDVGGVDDLGIRLRVSKEVSEFEFEGIGVVELGRLLWALQMEPKDGVHHALVVHDAVFQRFLQKTVRVVFFQHLALIGPGGVWLVKKVHP